jgi:pSer/pThr/pTyr-binding forkhead associated (FHA) protein
VRRVHDNSSLSHFSAMTRPCWLRPAARNQNRHAIEQASRRWRGGRRDDSARPRREVLISTQVSTTHAKIELKNDQIVLVDVGSTNGTSVDGEPIEEGKPHPLAAGNTVVFGASTFTVSEIKAA